MPAAAGTLAVRPVAPVVTGLAAVIVGATGTGTTFTFAFPVPCAGPFVTTHCSDNVPTAPAVNVTLLPVVPEVKVPFEIVHAYVAPDWLGTEAVRPVAPVVAFAGAVMVATGAGSTCAHAVALMAAVTESVAVTER